MPYTILNAGDPARGNVLMRALFLVLLTACAAPAAPAVATGAGLVEGAAIATGSALVVGASVSRGQRNQALVTAAMEAEAQAAASKVASPGITYRHRLGALSLEMPPGDCAYHYGRCKSMWSKADATQRERAIPACDYCLELCLAEGRWPEDGSIYCEWWIWEPGDEAQ